MQKQNEVGCNASFAAESNLDTHRTQRALPAVPSFLLCSEASKGACATSGPICRKLMCSIPAIPRRVLIQSALRRRPAL